MRRFRLTEEQTAKILREADKSPVAEVVKKHGIGDQTIYQWHKHYGQLSVVFQVLPMIYLRLPRSIDKYANQHPGYAD